MITPTTKMTRASAEVSGNPTFQGDLSPEESPPHPTPNEDKGHTISNKINFISSKLTKMSPKARGVIQAWLQRSTNKSAFKTRTAQLIRILSSPSKTAQLMKRLHADAEESSETEESSEAEDSEAEERSDDEESSGDEYSDGEESSDGDDSRSSSDSEMSQNSEKIDYISSKLMNMAPKVRGVVQGWLQRSTNKKAFKNRTAQLIRVLRSPSKTKELMQCLQSSAKPAAPPAQTPTPEWDNEEQKTVGFITDDKDPQGCLANSKRRLMHRQCSNDLLSMPEETPSETEEPTATLEEEPSTEMPEEPTTEAPDSGDHASLYGWETEDKAEADRLARAKAEADRLAAKAEADRMARANAEADRLAAAKAEADRLAAAKAEDDRLAEEPTAETPEEPSTETPAESPAAETPKSNEPDNTFMITVGVGCLIAATAGVSYLLYKTYNRSR